MAVIECVCPVKPDGTVRHPNGDRVKLREKLDFRSGLQARNSIVLLKQDDPDADAADILAGLTEVYLLVGIESWTLADAKGKPVEVSRGAIRQFLDEHPDEAMEVGDEADGLYSQAVIAPLVARALTLSQPTQTGASTSATNGSSLKTPKPSKRSSTMSSPTDVTVTMSASPDGVSN